ncbi:S41 family peptidase [Flagellimonas sp.]|uniref:S41 family peptidase n=1 Tax=Flagellimonas sp. TaxID=2058762 RepID=UPI003BABDE01
MKKIIFTAFLVFPFILFSQNCDCESNFNWVKKTFEENDAGFAYAISNKGEQAYQSHNEDFIQRIKEAENSKECLQSIKEWLTFFRSGHISLRMLGQNSEAKIDDKKIIQQYKDTESVAVDIEKFTQYLNSKKEVDYEGIWVSKPYRIGVKKIKDEYVGFIIEADGVYWTKGQVKFKIKPDNSCVYYMQDHTKKDFPTTTLLGNNYLQAGFVTLQRAAPRYDSKPEIDRYFEVISTNKPYFDIIDDHTGYLRIPTFSGSKKTIIDSVIAANKETILNSPNLIIDIRDNGGGSDRSFKELLPLLYTNPIRTVGVELLSTPLNNQRMLDFINNPIYDLDNEEKEWARAAFDKLETQLGSFVDLDSNVVNITTYDTIYPFPKKIGIIINENNGSTAEQFLLAAKQSKKVKLFGRTTAGVLDISNMYFVNSPCGELELGYCLSRSMRIPEMTIDDKGIQPDFYMDKTIPVYQWIDFVAESLKE